MSGGEEEGDCDHSFVLKDDIGYVCRICGVIDRAIETIFEFQYNKVCAWLEFLFLNLIRLNMKAHLNFCLNVSTRLEFEFLFIVLEDRPQQGL